VRVPEPGLLDHIDRVRRAVIHAALAVIAGTALALVRLGDIVNFLLRPLSDALGEGTLISTAPAEALLFELRLAVLAGLVIASPVVLYQLWSAVAPVLFRQQRRLALSVLLLSTILFATGCVFSHMVVFPMTWRFFAAFATDIVTFLPSIGDTFTLYQRLLLTFGVAFQLPVAALLLARIGLLTPGWLLRHGKYAVLAAFAISAVVTPTPDVFVQTALAVPLLLLYLLSAGVAWVFQPRPRVDAAFESGDDDSAWPAPGR
jgi:sec-independent protein translocase protein TatC